MSRELGGRAQPGHHRAAAADPQAVPPPAHRAIDYAVCAESIPHIVWVASPDGTIEYLNRLGTDYTGMRGETDYGGGWLPLIHPDDITRSYAAWNEAMRTTTMYSVEHRIRGADGQYRWHESRALPVPDAQGRLTRWIGTATDVHEIMSMQEEMRAAERHASESATLLETLQANAPVGFGFVDTQLRYLRVNRMLADINGAPMEAHLGRTVAEVVPRLWPVVEPACRRVLERGEAVLDLEVSGPKASRSERRRHWLVNMYPVSLDREVIGIGFVVVDISERIEAEAERRQVSHAAVEAMAATVEARDPYTAGHQRRAAQLSSAIATEMGVSTFDVEGISLAANIHDVGKIRVPAEILSRPGRLHPAEYALVKTHSAAGYDIVRGVDFPWPVALMIRQHHERFDGNGYPDGVSGHDIVLGARIIAVADVIEAMSAHRPYRPGLGRAAAIDEIQRGRGTLFDPDVVDALMRIVDRGKIRTLLQNVG